MTLREDLLQNPGFILDNNIFYQKTFPLQQSFEKQYVTVRTQEGRIYDDEIVKQFPEVVKNFALKSEWSIRKKSATRLRQALTSRAPKILEVGCGNGWLANFLGKIPGTDVIGIDVNETELLQAGRVFQSNNVTFVYGEIFSFSMITKFDVIVLASALQYFPDFYLLVARLKQLLSDRGEIHILDTPFYNENEIKKAQERTDQYFEAIKIKNPPGYFHHKWKVLEKLNANISHDPRSMLSRIKRLFVKNESPFPWIVIKK
jgi:SAM-dependent methyltransferase